MKTTIEDQIRLGSAGAQLKSTLKPAKWRKLVRAAHKQGYTVSGALSGAPNPLKERTNSSLVKQAKHTVSLAYKPALAELDIAQQRADALDAKRQSDNKSYAEWLAGQTQLLDAQARTADSALLDRQREIAQQSVQAWDDAHATAAANAAATAGNVSDPSQSKALDFSAAAKHTSDIVANQRQVSSDLIGSNEKVQGIANAAILAAAAARDAKRQSDKSATDTELQSTRTKLTTGKVADVAKEISRLIDNEQSKAQNNRDFSAAAQKLGLDTQKFNYQRKQDKLDFGLKLENLNLQKWKETNANKWKQAQLDLNYDQLTASKGKAAADRALRKWIATHKKTSSGGGRGKSGPTDGARRDATKTYTDAETARGMYRDLVAKPPKNKTIRQVLRGRGVNDVMIDVIEDLRAHGGKLSKTGYQKAKSLGIAHYYERYKDPYESRSPGAGH